ncbi:phage/plasmid primase P4 [Acetobacter aceti NRIC 0242]|uniref:SF3 helicase domain-containing protein n=1 Tax=Acetobacter aceti NBRC 14818 TaxID=887700 RepID=A0AB33IEZ0_ACEAC|nr:phage/plasmid primase, P4 family [Acetobacter aceti]TCS33058.1 putative DNA primase/helicase [Acetobacter aceti NBRC 14818]BCK76492.1 hypothetical protein EMQ_2098 [Acetobacter aceti NBRC 14818]GAN58328.1 hypothetical protein Abac_042_001 [Acetobacter aceti NBRC 14818]GBO81595.1 phage/plasmid primase P4 [Acetobacter aceti NRIC 0242]
MSEAEDIGSAVQAGLARAEKRKAGSNEYVLLTEHGVAEAFTDRYRDQLRFCQSRGKWFLWSGTHWQVDSRHKAFTYARELVAEANSDSDLKAKAVTGKASFAGGVERFARCDPAHSVTSEDWDTDPFLLATPAGTVDLHTGILKESCPKDMISKVTAVGPDKQGCPIWLAFLRDATNSDDELIEFLQRWCGYCLTGDTREHALLFGYGPGGNGKSVFPNTISKILGDYAMTAAMDSFTVSYGDKHSTDLAMLRGARLVTASETEEGRAWAEARIKQMTGGDPITARFMRQDNFTFVPQFKLTIVGNHKPELKNVDDAMRRRLNMVPFIHKPKNPDRELELKLVDEWSAILQWMIEGCLKWQESGLPRPKVVREATDEYFEAQDSFGQWLAERCILDPGLETKPSLLLKDFQDWSRQNGELETDNKRLRGLLERTDGVRYLTRRGSRWVRGVGMKPREEDARRWDRE